MNFRLWFGPIKFLIEEDHPAKVPGSCDLPRKGSGRGYSGVKQTRLFLEYKEKQNQNLKSGT